MFLEILISMMKCLTYYAQSHQFSFMRYTLWYRIKLLRSNYYIRRRIIWLERSDLNNNQRIVGEKINTYIYLYIIDTVVVNKAWFFYVNNCKALLQCDNKMHERIWFVMRCLHSIRIFAKLGKRKETGSSLDDVAKQSELQKHANSIRWPK